MRIDISGVRGLASGTPRKYKVRPWDVSIRTLYEDSATWRNLSEHFKFEVGKNFRSDAHKKQVMKYAEGF